MSLRRTALARKSELRRTPMPRRKRELRAKQIKAISRPKDTGPSPKQRNLVLERADGCCELCGVQLHDGTTWIRTHSFHHRRPRGAGGSRRASINSPANVLLLCGSGTTGCHGKVEAGRRDAYAHGWLVKSGHDPAATPVDVGPFHVAVLLTDDGEYQEAL